MRLLVMSLRKDADLLLALSIMYSMWSDQFSFELNQIPRYLYFWATAILRPQLVHL